ncbi:unnamed protein product [Linum trigynum]|uniref:DNA primase small subunit n=1 Tax=Linum trigynum TaxID=586398 RepID=A0AAV2E912_9ROSI
MKDIFERKLLPSLQVFSTEDRCEKIFGIIPDESARAEIRRRWQNSGRSSCSELDINLVLWEQLKYTLQSGSCKAQGLHRYIEEIVLSFTNPRLDMMASRQMDYLLMTPFCVHPITARVCVPIDPVHCDEFDPRTVPTLAKLLRELKLRDMDEEWEDYDFFSTSHGKYLSFFRSSFLEPLLKSCKEEMENAFTYALQEMSNSQPTPLDLFFFHLFWFREDYEARS